MTDVSETAAAPKTLGDYGVEIDEAIKNNTLQGVPPIIAEMRAAAPATPPAPPEPVPPANLGLAGYADALDAAVGLNNVVEVRSLASDMQVVEPPSEVAPEGAPTVVDVPYASQTGANLQCTMGNWTNEPTSYAYQWQSDGEDVVGAAADYYVVQPTDVGHSFTCVVTASNAVGSATASPSNAVVAA